MAGQHLFVNKTDKCFRSLRASFRTVSVNGLTSQHAPAGRIRCCMLMAQAKREPEISASLSLQGNEPRSRQYHESTPFLPTTAVVLLALAQNASIKSDVSLYNNAVRTRADA
jgi:hypothetical protein